MPTAPQVTEETTLVVSWSGCLHNLVHGYIMPSDLDGALFYFTSTRDSAMSPDIDPDLNDLLGLGDPETVAPVQKGLQELVVEAEADGRVHWRQADEYPTFEALNIFLRNLGRPTLPVSAAKRLNLPLVEEFV